jgi:quinol monooxygenase YgiN
VGRVVVWHDAGRMSIRHIVLWKLRDPADGPRFKALLESCAEVVPGIEQFEVALRGEGYEASADVVLLSTFTSSEALSAYQGHPHHKQVAAQLGAMRSERHVFDYPTG